MVNGWYIWILKNRIIGVLFITILFTSCLNDNIDQNIPSNVKFNIDVKSGDVVLRLGNGYFSSIFKNYASREKKYSHIGVISVEVGVTYVYHSEASEFTGIGKIKKETLDKFIEGISIFDFYRLERENTASIAKIAKSYYDANTPFDLDFNTDDDSELYCAELVANAINIAMNEAIIKPTIILGGKQLYGLDDIYIKLQKLKK